MPKEIPISNLVYVEMITSIRAGHSKRNLFQIELTLGDCAKSYEKIKLHSRVTCR